MKAHTQLFIDDIMALNGDVLSVEFTPDALVATLKRTVAITNFKRFAALGRSGTSSYNPATKTVRIPRLESEFQPGSEYFHDAGVLPVMKRGYISYTEQQWATIRAVLDTDLDVLQVLGKVASSKKFFNSPLEAKVDRSNQLRARVQRAMQQDPDEMDIPVWDGKQWSDTEY